MSGEANGARHRAKEGEGALLITGGVFVTLVMLVAIAALLWIRAPEYIPLTAPLPPGAVEPARLTLSEIGNVLAGIFAPLAFLWLFIATMLQRKELGYQRRELELQRDELKLTREELSKTAVAANNQANYMSENVRILQRGDEYQQYSLLLYYFAVEWKSAHRGIIVPLEDENEGLYFPIISPNEEINPKFEETYSIDLMIRDLHAKITTPATNVYSYDIAGFSGMQLFSNFVLFYHLISSFSEVHSIATTSENPMIISRSKYLSIDEIMLKLRKTYELSSQAAMSEFEDLRVNRLPE